MLFAIQSQISRLVVSLQNPLEAALEAALADSSRSGGVETALLGAELYVCPTDGAPPEGVVFGRDVPFTLNGLVLDGGRQATAAFTQPEFATSVFGEPASMGIRGRHLLEAFQSGWIVLNPGQQAGLILSPTDIAAILARAGDAQPTVENPDLEVLTPEQAPTALIANMKAVLDHPAIRSAWVSQTRDRRSGETGWRIEVYGDLDVSAVRERVQQGARGLNFGDESLNLLIGPASETVGAGYRIV